MITVYKNYLEQKLKDAGMTGKIYFSLKELKQYSGVEIGAVLSGQEEFARETAKGYVTVDRKKVLRKKVYKRITNLVVVISGKDDAVTDEIMCSFLASLDLGIDDGKGNWSEIECQKGDWVDEVDSVLRNKIAVQLLVKFTGGIYIDKPVAPITDIEVGN